MANDFLATYTPLANDIATHTGLDPSVVLGIIDTETGGGQHVLGNNIFGISPGGKVAQYPDVQTGSQAFVSLMQTPRYQRVAAAGSPAAQAAALVKSGYNTVNPDYATTVATKAQNFGKELGYQGGGDAKPTAAPDYNTPAPAAAPAKQATGTAKDRVLSDPALNEGQSTAPGGSAKDRVLSDPSLQETAKPPEPEQDPLSGGYLGGKLPPPTSSGIGRIGQAAVEGYKSGGFLTPEAQAAADAANNQTWVGRNLIAPAVSLSNVPLRAMGALGGALGQGAYEAGNLLGGPSLGRDFYMGNQVVQALPAISGGAAPNYLRPPEAAPTPRFVQEYYGEGTPQNALAAAPALERPSFVPPGVNVPPQPVKVEAPPFVPPEAATAGPGFLNSSWVRRAGDTGAGYDMGKGGAALAGAAQDALDSGSSVVLVTDGGSRTVPIVGVKNGMLMDDKGQRWGSMSIASDATGREGLRITPKSGAAPNLQSVGAGASREGTPTDNAWIGNTRNEIERVVQENAAQGGPASLGAAATPQQLATMSPQMAKAYRRMAEIKQVVSPIEGEDASIKVPGSIPTEAERMGDPLISQKEVMTRQSAPNAFEGEQGRLTLNNKARVAEFDNLTLSDPQIRTIEEDQAKQASKDEARIMAKAGPVDGAPVAAKLDALLRDPKIAEQPDVVRVLQPIREALNNKDGSLKTDVRAYWGMHANLMTKLDKAKDPLQATGSEKYAFNQLVDAKKAIDDALSQATGGAFGEHLQNQAEFFQQLNAAKTLRDFRTKMIDAKTGNIYPNTFHKFVTDLAVRRGKPGVDPAMDIPDETMQRLIAIDDDLKRAGRIDLGKPRGSPTNLYFELARGLGIAGAHAITAASGVGPIGNVFMQGAIQGVERRLSTMRLNRLVRQALEPPNTAPQQANPNLLQPPP